MFKTLDKLIEKTNCAIDQAVNNVSKVATKLQTDPSLKYGVLWELSESCQNCRYCQTTFQMPLLKPKHHCRVCAGVYCSDCSAEKQMKDERLRVCKGCENGEVPSQDFINTIRKELEKDNGRQNRMYNRTTTQSEKTLEQVGTALSKVGDSLGIQQDLGPGPFVPLPIHRGSAFNDKSLSNKTPPLSGYFELTNKGTNCIAIKVLKTREGNVKIETVRPSYFVLPPGGIVHSFFEQYCEEIIVIILFDNPNAITSNIIYDTRAQGAKESLMSPCAKVSEFRTYTSYAIPCQNRNVLVKVRNGDLQPRKGDSLIRVGILGKIQGKKFVNHYSLDFGTNITSVNSIKR